MIEMVVKIDSKGNVSFLYDDALREPLSALGEMSMRRASNIKWNEVTQMWDLFTIDDDGKETFHSDFENRNEAIAFEVENLPRLLEA